MTAAQQRCSYSTSLLPILQAEFVEVYSQLTTAPFTVIIKVHISEIRGQQNRPLVTWDYTILVVAPSVLFYAMDELTSVDIPYFSLPWEFEADAFGEVAGRQYDSSYSYLYMWYTDFVSQITGNKMNYPTPVAL